MKSKYYIGTLILILVLGVVALSGCTQNPQNNTTTNQTTSPTQNQSNATKYTVTIQNFAFNPGTLTVPVGTTVKWANQDPRIHRVYSNTEVFESKDLNTGDSYSYKFTKAGTYKYHCSIHPNMTGTIIVQ